MLLRNRSCALSCWCSRCASQAPRCPMLRNSAVAGVSSRAWPATNHPSEDLFRLRKATLYADIIEAGGITIEAVDGFTDGQWAALAIVAQTKPPSKETCAVIRQLLH